MRKYDLVLFDWDGTLSVTDDLIVKSVFDLADIYSGGEKPSREKIISVAHLPLRGIVAGGLGDVGVPEPVLCDAYVRYACKNLVRGAAPLCDGALEMLRALRSMGVLTGVFSNKDKKQLDFFALYTGVSALSDVVVSVDDVKNVKPAPDGVFLAMKKTGVTDPDRVLYVGDNTIDYDLAVNSGAHSAIVTYAHRNLAGHVNPDYYISSLCEITDICK